MLSPARGAGNVSQLPGPSVNPFWWQSRLYPDSGIGGDNSQAFPAIKIIDDQPPSHSAIFLINKDVKALTNNNYRVQAPF